MVTIQVTQPQLSARVWEKEASQTVDNIGGVRSQQRISLSAYLNLPIDQPFIPDFPPSGSSVSFNYPFRL